MTREALHRKSMTMLADERTAVDLLTQSYECLALAVRAAYTEIDEFNANAKDEGLNNALHVLSGK